MMNLSDLTIKKLHQLLVNKEISAAEVAKEYLRRIEKFDKKIHAFLTISEELALSQAKIVDTKIKKGEEVDIMAGIPLAVKDNILVKDIRATAGSKILENYIAPYDATVIEKLRTRGAIILGKTNLDEFAMGASTENSAFGPTHNPFDLSRVPGGSSGGSAAAVAADMTVCALGSDTGGSIRQPASFCGVVGLKPTYGAVSRYGLIAMASSLDQIGPFSKTVEDCRIVFEAIKGKDEMDSTSVEINPKAEARNPKPRRKAKGFLLENLRIGVPKEYFIEGIDPEVKEVVEKAIKKYQSAGAKVEEISLPLSKYALPCYYIIVPSEVSANLSRYDGIKYGLSKGVSLMDIYLDSRAEGLGPEVKRRIMLGTYALSSGYYDAYYLRAQKVRTLIREDFERALSGVEVLLTPVSPTVAFKIGEKSEDPLSMYLADIFTVSVNLAGLPALTFPCGKTRGLPVGLQIIGRPFEEETLLSLGEVFEKL